MEFHGIVLRPRHLELDFNPAWRKAAERLERSARLRIAVHEGPSMSRAKRRNGMKGAGAHARLRHGSTQWALAGISQRQSPTREP
jgi:hypothetical protein